MKLGILTDLHEDCLSLVRALQLFEKEKCDEVVCLGDITGFNVRNYKHLHVRNAHECIQLVRQHCAEVIIGNHDLHHIRKLPTYSNGFEYPSNWYDLAFDEKKSIGEGKVFLYDDFELSPLLGKDDIAYLTELPELVVKEIDGMSILLTHFAYPDITGSRSYYPRTLEEGNMHLSYIVENNCHIGITGHFHYPGVAKVTKKVWEKFHFGSQPLSEGPQWIYGPCAVRAYKATGEAYPNGVMILDTQEKTVTAIPLGHG